MDREQLKKILRTGKVSEADALEREKREYLRNADAEIAAMRIVTEWANALPPYGHWTEHLHDLVDRIAGELKKEKIQ